MNILILDTNVKYLNPTRRYFIECLSSRANVVLAGYGYSLDTTSIIRLQQKYGKFDLIFAESWVFDSISSGPYAPFIPRDIYDIDIPIILNALQIDLHDISESFYKEVINRVSAVVTSASSPQFKPNFSDDAFIKSPWLNRDSYLIRNPNLLDDRFIFIPHCLEESEFRSIKNKKKYDVSILGIFYYFRQQALNCLTENSTLKVKTLNDILQKTMRHLNSKTKWTKWVNLAPIYRYRFNKVIENSIASITCDAGINYAVRKFFEIPALGTLLAGQFFANSHELGFIDKENCFHLSLDRMDELSDLCGRYKSVTPEYKKIVENSQNMLREYHLVETRVQQFLDFAEAITSNRNVTTRWQCGRQVVLERAV